MKRTTKYQLGYFEEGDTTSSSIEMQRWETLDAQLYAMFSMLGNGVIDGWGILPSSGLSIIVAPGSGHVNFVSVESEENVTVDGLAPSARNYIYASLTPTSYWDNSVFFVTRIYLDYENLLYLGYVDTNATTITAVNTDNRAYLGFINLITTLISEHHHIGGTGNPPPVNLASEVQGVINQNNLPDLDASIIQTGTLDADRLPLINHITGLINQGTLTHAQLDSFVEALNIQNATLMGETSTIDLLQLIMALKHVYPDIDRYLVNEIAYIPGISPDDYVDWVNTTAVVDTRPYSAGGTHTITGLPAPAKKAYTYTWDSEAEFESGTYSDVTIDGDRVSLATQETKLTIDEFSDLSQWSVITTDLSSTSISLSQDASTFVVPPNSAKLTVGDQTVEIALIIKKEFDARDWSQYGRIVFYLKTESVQHGDIFFYLNDAIAGTQQSHIKILDRNEPTVNIDTLQNGWQEITVDISSYTRTNINTIGFYISSQDGWDTSKGFDLNIDNVYLTTGVLYKENGYIREIFGNGLLYDFWRVRWNAVIPTDTPSAGLVFKVRTRVGNTLADINQAIWSAYTTVSGSDISLPAPGLYKYIQIEAYFGASTDYTRSAFLSKLFLDFYVSDVDGSFNYDSKDDWDSGSLYNIDTSTVVDSMLISHTDEINDIFYGTNGKVIQLDDNLAQLYEITGSMLPRSTYQILNDIPPSLGLITGVSRGNDGNIWLCDTDNDRVMEVDKSGSLVRGFFGSYLVENTAADVTTTTTTTTSANAASIALTSTLNLSNASILQTLYNFDKGFLYIIFSRDLLDTELASITDQQLRIGSNIFYLDAFTTAKVMNGFDNVLKVTIVGANFTALNHMLYSGAPSIVISSPYEQQQTTPFQTVKFLIYNFTLGTGAGQNGIRVTLDSGIPQTIYDTEITYSNLTTGKHTVVAQLINADGSLNTNIEAIATGSFVVYQGTYALPYVSITSPKPNQIYSSYPVQIDFDVRNFPILSTGQHVRYIVDSGAPVDYYSETPILINTLSHGRHTICIYLVDKWGTDLGYLYGSATVEFIVGTNSNATVKYYCNISGDITNVYTDVSNFIFTDVYSPFDIQYIMPGTDISNPSDKESILIGKLTNDYIFSKQVTS